MGRLRGRIAKLEERYGVGSEMFDPRRGYEEEQQRRMRWVAIKRLSGVELLVLEDLLRLREEHPGLSGAEFYGLMTPVQHEMERRWSQVLREVRNEHEAPA